MPKQCTTRRKQCFGVLRKLLQENKRLNSIENDHEKLKSKYERLQKEYEQLQKEHKQVTLETAQRKVIIAGLELNVKFPPTRCDGPECNRQTDGMAPSASDKLEVLGAGGYGTVFEMKKDGMSFALKQATGTPRKDVLQEELQKLSLCKRKGVKGIVPFFHFNDGIGMVKFPSTLYDEIEEGGVSYERSVDIVEQLVKTVTDMHDKNIMHGDIKPGNILCYRRALFVSDLGLACELGEDGTSLPEDRFPRCEYWYYPPAVARENQPTGAGTDFWGIIIILLEVIFGHKIPRRNYKPSRAKYAQLLIDKQFSSAWKPPGHLYEALRALFEFVDSELDKSTRSNSPCFREAIGNFLASC